MRGDSKNPSSFVSLELNLLLLHVSSLVEGKSDEGDLIYGPVLMRLNLCDRFNYKELCENTVL